MTIEIPKSGFRDFIIELARVHNASSVAKPIDHWALMATRLLGDDIKAPDEVQQYLVNLKRSGVITGREMGQLLTGYLHERRDCAE